MTRPLRKVAYIDDETILSTIVELALRDIPGAVLSYFSSGADAIEILTKNPPDLILLDLVMPGMSGEDTLRELRRHPATAKTPAVLITGNIRKFDAGRFQDLGALAVLQKPFDPFSLGNNIRLLWEDSQEDEGDRPAAAES